MLLWEGFIFNVITSLEKEWLTFYFYGILASSEMRKLRKDGMRATSIKNIKVSKQPLEIT